jgi:hypothetical protein
MPSILNTLARLAARLSGRQRMLRITADARIVRWVGPMIERLMADTPDGEVYQTALAELFVGERPPLRFHYGAVSTFRLDGPPQRAGDTMLPLGGLLLSPGVTAHLDPFEAGELDREVSAAIEQAILEYIARRRLQDLRPVPQQIDRATADPAAHELIARRARSRQVLTKHI